MTTTHTRTDFAAILETLRAQSPGPLVCHAQDRATAQVGGAAWGRVPEGSDQTVRGGVIVDLWHDEGEVGVVCVSFRRPGRDIEVRAVRLLASDCASIEPASRYRCYITTRSLSAALGQRHDASGPPLSDAEEQWHAWTVALLRAARAA